MNKKSYTIAVDFDGTCVTHRYPNVGEEIGAAPILKKLVDNGHKIILLTMRDCGKVLRDATDWFAKHDIKLYGINNNPDQTWSDSRKVYAHIYIDDQAVGCPIITEENEFGGTFYYVDWKKIDEYFKSLGLYE